MPITLPSVIIGVTHLIQMKLRGFFSSQPCCFFFHEALVANLLDVSAGAAFDCATPFGVQDVQTEKGESKAWEPSETFADSAG